MRVLLLNYEFPPAGGGAGFATYNIAVQLAKLGVDVDVLTSRICGEQDAQEHGVNIYRVPSWRVGMHDCGLRGAYTYLAGAALKRRRLHSRHRYDLEHFFFGLPTGFLTLVPMFGRQPPYIISLRGSDTPGYDLSNPTVERLHGVLKPITRRIWRRAGRVVALSDGLRKIAQSTMPELPIDVIPNGIDQDEFYPPDTPEDARRDGPVRLITVARLIERKGIQELLQAIAQPEKLPVELTIVGTGPCLDLLRQQSADLGLNEIVRFLGFIEHSLLPDLYRQADIFVLPSHTESFGLVFAEAMGCGLPVIAAAVGGVPEVIDDGTNGILVQPKDAAGLRVALDRLVHDPHLRREMGVASRERVLANFTWRGVTERYLATYADVLADKPAMAGPTESRQEESG